MTTPKTNDSPLPSILSAARDTVDVLGATLKPRLPLEWQAVLAFVQEALDLGAELAEGGDDPVLELVRMRRARADMDAARQRVHASIDQG